MEKLDQDWITKGTIDFEYKKYVLLAYLKNVKGQFEGKKLYPFISDLLAHYRNLQSLSESKKLIYEQFPQQISKADFENLKISYEKLISDDAVMKEIEEILEYSLPKIKWTLNEGKELHDFVEEHLEILPIGLSPIYTQEGYLFIEESERADLKVYRYQVSIFNNLNEVFRGINTEFVKSEKWSISNSYENIKASLSKSFNKLPNPATYLVRSKVLFPFQETLLPVAKRLLIKNVSIT